MKTDARVRYTRRVIKESVLRLLEEKPVNRLTVKEVCDLAQINRATFYAHFADCFDVLAQIEDDLLRDFDRSLSSVRTVDVSALVEGIYRMIDANAEVCRVLIFQKRDASLLPRLIERAHDQTIGPWREQLPRASENELEMLFTCLANGLMNVVVGSFFRFDRAEVIRFVDGAVRSLFAPYR